MQEEYYGWESSDKEEDVTAIRLLQAKKTQSADSVSGCDEPDNSESESENKVLVSEEEELKEVNELAFEKLIKSAQEQSRQSITSAP